MSSFRESSFNWLGDGAPMSPRLRSLYKAAEEKECLAQMEKCFRKAYVEQVLQGNAKKAAGEVLELLQLSVHTHDKLQAMEQKMCVADFAKRLCAGHWEITGTESGETPALWMRIGLATSAFGSRRSLRPGTQEWYAAIRAYVYMYELFIRSRHLRSEVPAVKVICLDMRGQGFLDANLKFERTAIKLITNLFPQTDGEKLCILGHTKSLSGVFKPVSKLSPRRKEAIFITQPEEIFEYVQKKSNVPAWFLNFDSNAKPITALQVWGLVRFTDTDKTGRVSHANIFNPSSPTKVHSEESGLISIKFADKPARNSKGESALTFACKPAVGQGDFNSNASKSPLETIYSIAASSSLGSSRNSDSEKGSGEPGGSRLGVQRSALRTIYSMALRSKSSDKSDEVHKTR